VVHCVLLVHIQKVLALWYEGSWLYGSCIKIDFELSIYYNLFFGN